MSYELRESTPTVDRFLELRAAADMAERSREAVERGLPNSLYAVTVVETESETTVGMARVVGDVDESEALVCQPERDAFW